MCLFFFFKHAPKKSTEQPGTSKIEGERILLSERAPQLRYISLATAQFRKSAAVNLYGRLVWDEDETVRIFSPMAGRVSRVAAEIGQAVNKEDLLATIDSPDFGQAQSDAGRAQSDLALSEKNLDRAKTLYQHGAAPRKDFEEAQANYDQKLSEFKRSSARLDLYGGKTGTVDGLFHLRTPLDGVVVEKNITLGQEVRSDQMLASVPLYFNPLFVVSNPRHFWILLDVSESYLPLMKAEQKLKIHSNTYPDKMFQGKLEVIGHSLDPSTRTVKARGSVKNPDDLLKAEMYVTVDLEEETHPAGVEVSSKAVFLVGDKQYVFAQESAGQFTRREVKVGPERDGQISILEGLQEGEQVVAEGSLLLEEMLESKET